MTKYKRLHKLVDHIIWAEWDPIGVNQFEGTHDEYATYIPQIVKLLLTGGTKEEIIAHLSKLAYDLVGDREITDTDRQTAKRLLALNQRENLRTHDAAYTPTPKDRQV